MYSVRGFLNRRFKLFFWSLLEQRPKVTRAGARNIPSRPQAQKYPFYCAFNLTGSTIYKKLSPPSTGVMTQGEILVFSAMQTLSAGA